MEVDDRFQVSLKDASERRRHIETRAAHALLFLFWSWDRGGAQQTGPGRSLADLSPGKLGIPLKSGLQTWGLAFSDWLSRPEPNRGSETPCLLPESQPLNAARMSVL
jgi:hypothetical protein